MKILAVVILILTFTTVFAAYFVYYEYTHPSTTTRPVQVLSYSTTANYQYTAYLFPNDLYNATSITSGEGTLFTNLTKSISVRFVYSVVADRASDVSLTCDYTEFLIGSTWNKTLLDGSVQAENASITSTFLTKNFTVDVQTISSLVESIDGETGIVDSSYTIMFVPTIVGSITSSGVTGNFFDQPVFNFTFSRAYGSRAGIIVPSNSTFTTLRSLVAGSSTYNNSSSFDGSYFIRVVSLLILAASGTSLGVAVFSYEFKDNSQTKQAKKTDALARKIAQYQEIISLTRTPPKTNKGTIIVSSLDDLVRLADMMGKPVLHYQGEGEGDVSEFYVLDGEICYVFSFSFSEDLEGREIKKKKVESENERG